MDNRIPIVLFVSSTLVVAPLFGEDQPHAEFMGVAPSVNVGIAASGQFSNVSSGTVTYHSVPLFLEQILPHDRLVIQASVLVPPSVSTSHVSVTSRTGADPFFQRRGRSSPVEPKALARPLWTRSFQQFRPRRR